MIVYKIELIGINSMRLSYMWKVFGSFIQWSGIGLKGRHSDNLITYGDVWVDL